MTSTDPRNTDPGNTDPGQSGTPPESAGLRPTRQRVAVTEALARVGEFRSAQQIHDQITTHGEKVGLATVYRTLAALAEVGLVDVLRTEEGEAVYRQCTVGHHHHHLVCRSCGATVEIEGPGIGEWADALGRQHGYGEITHELELFGTCAECLAG